MDKQEMAHIPEQRGVFNPSHLNFEQLQETHRLAEITVKRIARGLLTLDGYEVLVDEDGPPYMIRNLGNLKGGGRLAEVAENLHLVLFQTQAEAIQRLEEITKKLGLRIVEN